MLVNNDTTNVYKTNFSLSAKMKPQEQHCKVTSELYSAGNDAKVIIKAINCNRATVYNLVKNLKALWEQRIQPRSWSWASSSSDGKVIPAQISPPKFRLATTGYMDLLEKVVLPWLASVYPPDT